MSKSHPALAALAAQAEGYAHSDPNTSIIKLRQFAEALTEHVARHKGVQGEEQDDLHGVLQRMWDGGALPNVVAAGLHALRREGNRAVHGHGGTSADAIALLKVAHQIARWFHVDVCGNKKLPAEFLVLDGPSQTISTGAGTSTTTRASVSKKAVTTTAKKVAKKTAKTTTSKVTKKLGKKTKKKTTKKAETRTTSKATEKPGKKAAKRAAKKTATKASKKGTAERGAAIAAKKPQRAAGVRGRKDASKGTARGKTTTSSPEAKNGSWLKTLSRWLRGRSPEKGPAQK